ncbi:MAG: 15-cis-phytoene synthase [Verrucomicrobiota bacterium]|jgi:phytoene synthase
MEESRSITRKSASNLALSFVLLPRAKREGMIALYAFCREVDDVADDESVPVETRRARLAEWRADVARACSGQAPAFPVNREFQPIIAAHHLPFAHLDELLRGVEMDLDIKRYESFEHLEAYCYRVASVVGLLSIEIFGYTNPACRDYANHLGKALQLTNILRDVRTDAARGRIYLPLSEMTRYGVTESEILGSEYSDRFRQLAGAVAERARFHYRRARELLPGEDRRSMTAAELMGSVYWRLLCKLEATRFNVFGPQPTRLSKLHKLLLILRTWLRQSFGGLSPNYGTP